MKKTSFFLIRLTNEKKMRFSLFFKYIIYFQVNYIDKNGEGQMQNAFLILRKRISGRNVAMFLKKLF
jgi:hypothetical protein